MLSHDLQVYYHQSWKRRVAGEGAYWVLAGSQDHASMSFWASQLKDSEWLEWHLENPRMMIHDDPWLMTGLEHSIWIVTYMLAKCVSGFPKGKVGPLEESDASWDRRQDHEGNIYWSNQELQIRFFELDPFESDLEVDHVSSTGTDGWRA